MPNHLDYLKKKLENAHRKLDIAQQYLEHKGQASTYNSNNKDSNPDQRELYKNIHETIQRFQWATNFKNKESKLTLDHLINNGLKDLINNAKRLADTMQNHYNIRLDPQAQCTFFKDVNEIKNLTEKANSTPSPS